MGVRLGRWIGEVRLGMLGAFESLSKGDRLKLHLTIVAIADVHGTFLAVNKLHVK